jgi:hypothetical protein
VKKHRTSPSSDDNFDPGRRYPGLCGKVVDWVEHTFEDGRLYLNVRFTDHTELCWQITTRLTIEQGDLSAGNPGILNSSEFSSGMNVARTSDSQRQGNNSEREQNPIGRPVSA